MEMRIEVPSPEVGDIVCDCRYRHLRVVEVDGDDLVLEDGSCCSWEHCCDAVPHDYEHPPEVAYIQSPGNRRDSAMKSNNTPTATNAAP